MTDVGGARRFVATLSLDSRLAAIPLPFDPRSAFGRANAPVAVTINGYGYRSTISMMGGSPWIPFRRSHREAAGIDHAGPWEVTVSLDTAPRIVDRPEGVPQALGRAWDALSHTRQREWAESIAGAKRSDTRERRLAALIAALENR